MERWMQDARIINQDIKGDNMKKYKYDWHNTTSAISTYGKGFQTPGLNLFPEKLPLPTTKYYFAFGSNMSRKRMSERKVLWESVERATLKGFRLTFNKTSERKGFGYATIQKSKLDTVEGLLYKCESKEDALILDTFEHAPIQYKRVEKQVLTSKGKRVNAFLYIATKFYQKKGLKPTVKYLDFLLEGEKYLSREYVKKLKTFTPPKQDLRVFVYGTLKKGFGNHSFYCKDALKVEGAKIRGNLYQRGSLPYASVTDYVCIATRKNETDFILQEKLQAEGNKGIFKGSECINGELVIFDSWEDVSRLDSLEGFFTTTEPNNNHYTRVLTTCKTISGKELSCWVFIIGDKTILNECSLIKSGIYSGYTTEPYNYNYRSKNDYLDSSYYYAQLEAEENRDIILEDEDEDQKDLFDVFNNPKF